MSNILITRPQGISTEIIDYLKYVYITCINGSSLTVNFTMQFLFPDYGLTELHGGGCVVRHWDSSAPAGSVGMLYPDTKVMSQLD